MQMNLFECKKKPTPFVDKKTAQGAFTKQLNTSWKSDFVVTISRQ